MRFRWPEDTQFGHLVLDVEQRSCAHCGRDLHICDHRLRHIYTLEPAVRLGFATLFEFGLVRKMAV
jgi:hypothetical protein